jgi:hypothetical protein
VKYLWRDAVQLIQGKNREILISRLSSFDVTGLGIPPLSGETLVTYAGSLVGRDFRAIAQVAPFVLYDLLDKDLLEVWSALAEVVPLVWQHEIEDIDKYLV